MKITLAMILAGSFPAAALASTPPMVVPPGTGEWATASAGYIPFGNADTPTTSRQHLERMTELRDELRMLEAADGGSLSPQSRAYLTRKANRIFRR